MNKRNHLSRTRTMLIAILVATLLIGYPIIANADITFTSGPKGGKYYLVAKKISSILSDERYLNPLIPIDVIELNGSIDNLKIFAMVMTALQLYRAIF